MKKCVLWLVVFAICAGNVVHAEEGWVRIANNDSGIVWDIKAGSLELSKTRGEVPIAVVIGRTTDPGPKKVLFYKWYVPLKDCAAESGVMVSLNMSGEYQFENDFVFNGGNIASGLAEAICGAAKQQILDASQKSI